MMMYLYTVFLLLTAYIAPLSSSAASSKAPYALASPKPATASLSPWNRYKWHIIGGGIATAGALYAIHIRTRSAKTTTRPLKLIKTVTIKEDGEEKAEGSTSKPRIWSNIAWVEHCAQYFSRHKKNNSIHNNQDFSWAPLRTVHIPDYRLPKDLRENHTITISAIRPEAFAYISYAPSVPQPYSIETMRRPSQLSDHGCPLHQLIPLPLSKTDPLKGMKIIISPDTKAECIAVSWTTESDTSKKNLYAYLYSFNSERGCYEKTGEYQQDISESGLQYPIMLHNIHYYILPPRLDNASYSIGISLPLSTYAKSLGMWNNAAQYLGIHTPLYSGDKAVLMSLQDPITLIVEYESNNVSIYQSQEKVYSGSLGDCHTKITSIKPHPDPKRGWLLFDDYSQRWIYVYYNRTQLSITHYPFFGAQKSSGNPHDIIFTTDTAGKDIVIDIQESGRSFNVYGT